MRKTYFVYILTNATRMLYVGVTNSLERRMVEHGEKTADAYTARYNINRLVYFEEFQDVRDAIAREKQLKGWRRARKVELIERLNRRWKDLAEDWREPKR